MVTFPFIHSTSAVSQGSAIKDKLGLKREIRRDIATGRLFSIDRVDGKPTAAMFVSPCCMAAVTYSGSILCCKKCWNEVDYTLDELVDVSTVK